MSDLQRQPRITRPTTKLINNGEKAPLTFQRAAVAAETARLEAAFKAQTTASSASLPSSSPSPDSPLAITATQKSSDTNKETDSDDQEFTPAAGSKHQIISDDESSAEDSDGGKQRKRQKKKLKGNGM